MKKRLCNFSVAMFFLCLASPVFAGVSDGDITREKTVSKAYMVNPDAGVDIKNKYGNIYVTTWNEDKISIEVVIRVSGRNEESVNKRLNGINIELNALTSLVSAKTVISENSGNNVNMEINYTVKIPKKGSASLDNKYGNITIDKLVGKSDIDCKYGAVNIAELNNDSNSVKIEYCEKSSIGYVKSGTVYARYSGMAISKTGNLSLDSNYTNVSIKEAGNVKYSANYGDILIASANNLEGTGNYLVLKFGTISGNLDIRTGYSSIKVGQISEKANNISIAATYTNMELEYAANYAFDFDFSLRYADLNAPGLTYQSRKENGPSGSYKGFYKSEGRNKMTISSSYGNLKLTKE